MSQILKQKTRPDEGVAWIQPVEVPRALKRRFAVRCARLGLRQCRVLRALAEAFAAGSVDEHVSGADGEVRH